MICIILELAAYLKFADSLYPTDKKPVINSYMNKILYFSTSYNAKNIWTRFQNRKKTTAPE